MFEQFNIYSEKSSVDFSIKKATLAFRHPAVEKQFKKSYFKTNLQLGRACHIIAIFFYTLVGMWDAVVVDPSRLWLWIPVICIVSLVFILGFISSYALPDLYAGHWQQFFAFYVVMTGGGFTIVTIWSGSAYPVYNFAGIIFCLFFCYAFIRLTFLWASAAGNFIVALYAVAVLFGDSASPDTVISGLFYIVGINLLGMMVCYSLELMSRRDFVLNELLRQAENKAKDINIHLEHMVRERTKELNQANRELKISISREQDLVARLEKEEKVLQKSLNSLEQAEAIARLGYFERNWKTGEQPYWSKGTFKLLGRENKGENMTYKQFLAVVGEADRERVKQQIEQAVKTRTPLDLEFSLMRPDGTLIQIHGVADHFFDEDGRLSFTRGVMQDITDRKKSEAALKKLQDQLIQAQKMESVGRLAGGVAHDYNNISGIIIGYAELSMEKTDPGSELYANLEQILTAARRATDITRQLLAFARRQTIDPRVIDLNETVGTMLKILRRLIGEDIELAWQPGKGVWPVKIDPSQVDQILANLCVNARDAIFSVGKITIETDNVCLDEAYCATHAGFVPGDFSQLSVSDDGEGMSPETLDKIFEPFFTTKEIGRGTGLGMATVYGIIKQNQGFINVYTEPGRGTTVRVYLPRSSEAGVRKEIEKALEPVEGKDETILLVEDDVSILEMSRQILEGFGYHVLGAETPGKALDCAAEEEQIDLLITDVIMPEMNGRELAARIKEICPDLRILFMSGYTANVIAHHGVLEKGVNFISKPFSRKELAIKVRYVLDHHWNQKEGERR